LLEPVNFFIGSAVQLEPRPGKGIVFGCVCLFICLFLC